MPSSWTLPQFPGEPNPISHDEPVHYWNTLTLKEVLLYWAWLYLCKLWPLTPLLLLVYSFSFFFGGTGVWNQGLIFARQVFYHLSHVLSPKCYFWNQFCWLSPLSKQCFIISTKAYVPIKFSIKHMCLKALVSETISICSPFMCLLPRTFWTCWAR
jgi:hypothetical protein